MTRDAPAGTRGIAVVGGAATIRRGSVALTLDNGLARMETSSYIRLFK